MPNYIGKLKGLLPGLEHVFNNPESDEAAAQKLLGATESAEPRLVHETGPVSDEQALVPKTPEVLPSETPQPILTPETSPIEGPLGKFTSEERNGFLDRVKRNKGKIIGAGLIGGAIAANNLGGNNEQLKTVSKTPTVNTIDEEKSSEEQPEEVSKPENFRTTSAAKIATKGDQAPNQLQNVTDMLTPQTQDYQAQLKNAQDQRDAQVLAGQLGKSGLQIASGMSRTNMPNTEVLDTMIQHADNSLKDFDARMAMEKKDPNSEYSKGLQKFLKSMYGIDTNASAEAISGTMLKPIETMYENQQKAKAHTEDIKLKSQEMHLLKQAKLEQDHQKQMDAANSKTTALLESARGSPAVAQAEKDLYAISKVNSLVNLKGDPNNLSPQQMRLLTLEGAKIASGGVPTYNEVRGLSTETAPSWLADKAQMLINKPIPANAGAFAKALQEYTNSIGKDAQKVIHDKYGRVIESSKKQIGDDNYQTLKAQYLGRFNDINTNLPHNGKYPPGSTISVKGKQYLVGDDGNTLSPLGK